MITFKEYLEERSTRGMVIDRYLINPSVSETIGFINRSKANSIRLMLHNDDMYVWDAYYMSHDQFSQKELFHTGERVPYSDRAMFVIDSSHSLIGINFMSAHKKYIKDIKKKIEEKYDSKFKLDRKMSGKDLKGYLLIKNSGLE